MLGTVIGLGCSCGFEVRSDDPVPAHETTGAASDSTSTSDSSTGPTPTPTPTTDSADTGSTDSGDDEGDGPKLDVASMQDAGGTTGDAPGCDKVDFLFVIDNSGSMLEEQEALVASFGPFIDTIRDTLTAQDYRIMVVDTDDKPWTLGGFNCGGGECTCDLEPGCCFALCDGRGDIVINPAPQSCNGLACGDMNIPSGCSVVLGAGRTEDADWVQCGIVGGDRFMTDAQPDLEGTFACAARVGAFGDGSERPVKAAIDAVTLQANDGGCNAGFLRDDAVLVVTVITDEDDIDSPGAPGFWHDAFVQAKGGYEESIVFLGLLGDAGAPMPVCAFNEAEDAPRLRELALSFTHGDWASVCAPSYDPFFADAVGLIDQTCDEFHPEG